MIYQLRRDARVPLWHYDAFRTMTGIMDICLIKDEANATAPQLGPRVDLQPLSENLADMVEMD